MSGSNSIPLLPKSAANFDEKTGSKYVSLRPKPGSTAEPGRKHPWLASFEQHFFYEALFDFEPDNTYQMGLTRGDRMESVKASDQEGWCVASDGLGNSGLVPFQYLRLCFPEGQTDTEDAMLLPTGTQSLGDGTLAYPDGTMTANHQAPAGAYPDGCLPTEDGGICYPSGVVSTSSGKLLSPNGVLMTPRWKLPPSSLPRDLTAHALALHDLKADDAPSRLRAPSYLSEQSVSRSSLTAPYLFSEDSESEIFVTDSNWRLPAIPRKSGSSLDSEPPTPRPFDDGISSKWEDEVEISPTRVHTSGVESRFGGTSLNMEEAESERGSPRGESSEEEPWFSDHQPQQLTIWSG